MRLTIAGKRFTGFKKYEVNLVFNAIASSFSFTAQYDFLDTLLEYPSCEIHNKKGQLLIRGTVLPPTLKSSPMPEDIVVQGYSSAGVLEDCQIPTSLYPLQYDGMNLDEITTRILSGFFFRHVFSYSVKDDVLKPYETVEAKPGQKIKEFLNQLAADRNIILSHKPDGTLLYTRLDTTILKPIDTFEVGKHGIKKMTLQIDGQNMHNPIEVIGQADTNEEGDANQAHLTNPYVSYFRPKVVVYESGDEFDAEKACRNELGKELGGIKLTFETTKFNFPGKLILVKNRALKLVRPTEFFIESVKVKGESKDEDNYTYTCVLKDVYTNDVVVNVLSDRVVSRSLLVSRAELMAKNARKEGVK